MFTILIFIKICCSIPLALAFIIGLSQYLKGKYRHNLYQMMVWFSLSIWSFGQILADIFFSLIIKVIADYFIIVAGFSIVLFLDSVSREYVDPIKLSLIHILSATMIFMSFRDDAVRIDYREGQTELSYITGGPFKIVGALLFLVEGVLIFSVWVKMRSQSPKSLYKWAHINFIGGFLIGVITPIMYIGGLSVKLPGSADLMMGMGAFLCAYAFAKEPRLAYVMPFRAARISVIETNSGLALFTHDWVKSDAFVDNMIFSGMIQGLQGIMRESLKRGEVKEVHLDQAIMILQRSAKFPLVAVLVADKSNHSLRTALNQFMEDFDEKFEHEIMNFQGDIMPFDKAIELVNKNYPYIPTYD